MNAHDGGLAGSLAYRLSASSPVRQFLDGYRGHSIFRAPLQDQHGRMLGNNGDKLIALGGDRLLRECGANLVDSPGAADLIVLDGNGGMHESYRAIPKIFAELSRNYPNTPIAMLPASYLFPPGRMAEIIGDRDGSVTLFCRERYSYDQLLNHHDLPPNCRVELDHDTALQVCDEDWVSELRDRPGKSVLIVERLDTENAAEAFQMTRQRRFYVLVGKVMPQTVKRFVYPVAGRMLGARQTPIRRRSEQLLAERFPQAVGSPLVAMDISLTNLCSFQDFCNHIADARIVFTTRLHVGIFASMLGRPTFLFEGPYHKIRGVYEHSLDGLPGVHLLDA